MTEDVAPINILVSYYYMSESIGRSIRESTTPIRLLLDSGAFTAWKQGESIDLDAYCSYLEEKGSAVWKYFVLDVIGDAKATRENLEIMRKRGLDPIPIFTRGEDPAYLDELYSSTDLVGIGGIAGTRGNKGFVKAIMRSVRRRPCHLLGFTHMEWLKHYRPYSADTTGWQSGVQYARVGLYMGNGKHEALAKKDFTERPCRRISQRLWELGIDPSRLAVNGEWRNSPGHAANDLVYRNAVFASADIETNLGTKIFLALNTDYAVRELAKASEFLSRESVDLGT